jgi:hypothetical protein
LERRNERRTCLLALRRHCSHHSGSAARFTAWQTRASARCGGAEAEAQTLRSEVDDLAYERSRLSRKLEHLTALLSDLLALLQIDEQGQLCIEDALAFDGRTEPAAVEGWPDFDLVPDEPG